MQTDIEWFMKHAKGKKLYLDEVCQTLYELTFKLFTFISSQNGWPSTSYSGVKANSAKAVANTDNEEVCGWSFANILFLRLT